MSDVHFLIEGAQFAVPRDLLTRKSEFFSGLLADENFGTPSEGLSPDHPIELGGVTAFEMDAFLRVLYARAKGRRPKLATYDEWSAALYLSTMWEVRHVRRSAVSKISSFYPRQDPFDRIDLATRCQVSQWLVPAYETICTRWEPLTVEERERLGEERTEVVDRIRSAMHDAEMKTVYNMVNEAKELRLSYDPAKTWPPTSTRWSLALAPKYNLKVDQ